MIVEIFFVIVAGLIMGYFISKLRLFLDRKKRERGVFKKMTDKNKKVSIGNYKINPAEVEFFEGNKKMEFKSELENIDGKSKIKTEKKEKEDVA